MFAAQASQKRNVLSAADAVVGMVAALLTKSVLTAGFLWKSMTVAIVLGNSNVGSPSRTLIEETAALLMTHIFIIRALDSRPGAAWYARVMARKTALAMSMWVFCETRQLAHAPREWHVEIWLKTHALVLVLSAIMQEADFLHEMQNTCVAPPSQLLAENDNVPLAVRGTEMSLSAIEAVWLFFLSLRLGVVSFLGVKVIMDCSSRIDRLLLLEANEAARLLLFIVVCISLSVIGSACMCA